MLESKHVSTTMNVLSTLTIAAHTLAALHASTTHLASPALVTLATEAMELHVLTSTNALKILSRIFVALILFSPARTLLDLTSAAALMVTL